jgi:hypothetical protein
MQERAIELPIVPTQLYLPDERRVAGDMMQTGIIHVSHEDAVPQTGDEPQPCTEVDDRAECKGPDGDPDIATRATEGAGVVG